jgi:hypothetical protein
MNVSIVPASGFEAPGQREREDLRRLGFGAVLVIADTGPVGYLLLTGHIDILPTAFGTVVLPDRTRCPAHHFAPRPGSQIVASIVRSFICSAAQ